MALPADFSKIFASTATGGITPPSDLNYAKGWEWIGANPPEKNDFNYLQNLSDLKAKYLYDKTTRYEQRPLETVIYSDDSKTKYLTSRSDNSWGYYNATLNKFIPLSVSSGGTGVSSVPEIKTLLGLKTGAYGEVRTGTVTGTGNKSFSTPFPNGQVLGIAFCVLSGQNYIYSAAVTNATGSGFGFKPLYFAGGGGSILPADGETFYYIAWGN